MFKLEGKGRQLITACRSQKRLRNAQSRMERALHVAAARKRTSQDGKAE